MNEKNNAQLIVRFFTLFFFYDCCLSFMLLVCILIECLPVLESIGHMGIF